MVVRPGIEPETSRTADWRLTNWANQAAVSPVAARYKMQSLFGWDIRDDVSLHFSLSILLAARSERRLAGYDDVISFQESYVNLYKKGIRLREKYFLARYISIYESLLTLFVSLQ